MSVSHTTMCPRSLDPFYKVTYYVKWGLLGHIIKTLLGKKHRVLQFTFKAVDYWIYKIFINNILLNTFSILLSV